MISWLIKLMVFFNFVKLYIFLFLWDMTLYNAHIFLEHHMLYWQLQHQYTKKKLSSELEQMLMTVTDNPALDSEFEVIQMLMMTCLSLPSMLMKGHNKVAAVTNPWKRILTQMTVLLNLNAQILHTQIRIKIMYLQVQTHRQVHNLFLKLQKHHSLDF